MMMIRRVAPAFCLAAILGSLAACSSSPGVGGTVAVPLTCAAQPAQSVADTVGRAGGYLGIDAGRVIIPGKALNQSVRFTLSRPAGTEVGVDLNSDAGQQEFRHDATVFISVAHCTEQELGAAPAWVILRTDEAGGTRKLVTERRGNFFWAYTEHNSGFIIVAD